MKCQIELNLNIKYSKEGLAQGHRPNMSQVLNILRRGLAQGHKPNMSQV